MPQSDVHLGGKHFTLLGLQRAGTAVYRGEGMYARIGDPSVIARDIAYHREMEKAKYPVAPILAEGTIDGRAYFIEKSLGSKSYTTIFADELESGRISDESFAAFLNSVKTLYTAQLKAADGEWSADDFAIGIRLPDLMSELPAHRSAIQAKFTRATGKLRTLPGVLAHGDCNPSNMYEGGIIDLEDSFRGPLGYDAVSALTSIEWSPPTRNYEYFARYSFTPELRSRFMDAIDKLHHRAKLPPLSDFKNELSFCRAVWLCAGLAPWPRLQQWRYDTFVSTYLDE